MSEVPFAYLEDDYLCSCCQTEWLKQSVKELEDVIVMQSVTIQEKDKLIDELTKENKAYKEVIQKWQDDANKTYWG